MRKQKELIHKLKKEIALSDTVEKKIEEAYSQIRAQTSDENRTVYRSRRKMIVVSAVCIALLGTTFTVMAATGFFEKQSILNKGTLTYEFDIDYELKPGKFEVKAEYIPEGYVDQNNGKYSFGTEDKKICFTILPIITMTDIDQQNNMIQNRDVENVEHTILSGMEADILTYKDADKYEMPVHIYLFNPQEGYVVMVYGSYGMPLEELKKVADSLVITRVGDSEASYLSESERSQQKIDEERMQRELIAARKKGVSVEQIVPMGESFTYPAAGYNGFTEESVEECIDKMSYTVKAVEVLENLTEINPEHISQYEELESWMNEDGSLRPYTRVSYDVNGKVVKEEVVEQCFLKVTAVVEYSFDEEKEAAREKELGMSIDQRVPLDASIVRLGTKSGDKYEYAEYDYQPLPSEHNYLHTDGRCIGINKPQHYDDYVESKKQFFYRDMEDGEKIEYQMLFVIDKDLLDENFVLEFNGTANSGMIYPDSWNSAYFAIDMK